MPRGKESSYQFNFVRFHTPHAVVASRFSVHRVRAFSMPLKLLADLVGDEIRLGHENPKRLARLLPTTSPFDLPLVGHGDHQLDRRRLETMLIRSGYELDNGAEPDRCPPTQFLPVLLQERPQKLRLPLRLANWRGHSDLLASVHAAPLISTRAVGPDGQFFFGHRLALDDKQPPAMHEQMIDLAHPG